MASEKTLTIRAVVPRIWGDIVSVSAPNGPRRMTKAAAKANRTTRRREVKKLARQKRDARASD